MRSIIPALLLLASLHAEAQKDIATLKQDLQKATADSDKVLSNLNISVFYEELNSDSAIFYANRALDISQKNDQPVAQQDALCAIAYQLMSSGKLGESLRYLVQAFALASKTKSSQNSWILDERSPEFKRLTTLSRIHNNFGHLMSMTQNVEQEIFHYKEAARIADEIDNKDWSQIANQNLSTAYLKLNRLDSALYFAKRSESLFLKAGSRKNINGWQLVSLGDVYFKMNNLPLAKEYYYKSLKISNNIKNIASLTWGYFMLTQYYLSTKEKDSSLYYSYETIKSLNSLGFEYLLEDKNLGLAYENLYKSFQLAGKPDSVNKYLELALITKDSLYKKRITSLAEFQNLTFNEQLRLQNEKNEKIVYQNRVRTYGLLLGILVFMIIAFLLFTNNRNRRKANEVLLKQKDEIELQKNNVDKTLAELRATQSQLIQSEKMASLGELTAGIAHEIQNPLNFVNNFAEVNTELNAEGRDAIQSRSWEDAEEILGLLADNNDKILHHGKRADAIVKGMLQHSRTSSGVKEPTDINALVDEYLRLSYHGMSARNDSFKASFTKDLDNTIGKIDVMPQDIGRVLLNLFNNAFYAVWEKSKTAGPDFQANVNLATRKTKKGIEITVADNGNGIPESIKHKIFQPFFTTKPTGEGTGLGLSLSYDIVKAHGGEIKVESTDGEGTVFMIILP